MLNHFINGRAKTVMCNRLTRTFALAAALIATAAAVFTFSHAVSVTRPHAAAQIPSAALRTRDSAPPTLLPAVMVRSQLPIPTLPTVTVRLSRAEAIANDAPRAGDYSLGAVAHGGSAAALGATPSGGFDMPYYSFGKGLRHANKE